MKKIGASSAGIFLIIINFAICGASLFAQTASGASSSSSGDWVVAAEKFTFAKNAAQVRSDDATLSVLPSLILEQLAGDMERMPTAEERLSREEYDLRQKRIDLFLQFSREVQTRNAIALENISERELARRLRDADATIADLKAQIDKNLSDAAEARKNAEADIAAEVERRREVEAGNVVADDGASVERSDTQRFLDLFRGSQEETRSPESVRLYNDDFAALFDAGEAARNAGYESREFEKAVMDANINALLTGTLSEYGGYVAVTVSLVVYPGARTERTVTEVGSLSDLRTVAAQVARSLTSAITNSMPVELFFTVQPAEAAENVTISIDGVVYRGAPESVTVNAGVHSILFSAQGFKQAGTSYAFRGERSFKIDATLVPDEETSLSLRLRNAVAGTVYANGVQSGAIDDENQIIKLTINDEPVLGQFITEDGSAAPFYIAYRLLEEDALLSVNVQSLDRNEYIDKRRRWMYASYSALITSLLGTFFAYGTFHAQNSAYAIGAASRENVLAWRNASLACIGVSIGCGAWLVYELVRYLVAADSVLPANARMERRGGAEE